MPNDLRAQREKCNLAIVPLILEYIGRFAQQDRGRVSMNVLQYATRHSEPRLAMRISAFLVSLTLLLATCSEPLAAYQDQQATEQSPPSQSEGQSAPPYTQQTPEQLQQLVGGLLRIRRRRLSFGLRRRRLLCSLLVLIGGQRLRASRQQQG